jgi:DNA replication and repair protein RecF
VYLARLALTDFRCYHSAALRLERGASLILGGNGQGKTSLLEAAAYLSTLSSHRAAADGPVVRHGAERALLRGAVRSAARESLVEVEINPGRANRARLNRSPVPRPREVLGVLATVLFAPEDLALVKGDPQQRRRFLDDLLCLSAPRYAAVRAEYERVLRQRTALLKSLRPGAVGRAREAAARTLDVWDEQLAGHGAELLAGRLRLVAALRPEAARAYAAVSGEATEVSLRYRQVLPGAGTGADGAEPPPDRPALAAALRQALARVQAEEVERGQCLAGPHRDDLDLRIAGLPARSHASQGEAWSLALALRLASFEHLRADGGDPVLLLDDVFAELDAGRRERLAKLVAGAEQVLVTAAVAEDVPSLLAGARFWVADGSVSGG